MSRLTAPALLLFLLAVFFTPVAVTADQEPAETRSEKTAQDQPTVTVEEVVVPPQVIIKSQVPPDYPPSALAGRFEGVVTVELRVLKDGTVSDVKVVDCNRPNIGFEEAAIAATSKWRFEAAMKEGEPIEYTSRFRVNFRVGPGGQPFVSWGAGGGPSHGRSIQGEPRSETRQAAGASTRGPSK